MIPLRPINYTRLMAANQPEYTPLAIRDGTMPDGTPYMTAVFEPTPAELADLNAGGAVVLHILGTGWPPVILQTQPAPEGQS